MTDPGPIPPRFMHLEGSEGLSLAADMLGGDECPTVLLAHGGGQTRHAWGGAALALALRGWRAVSIDQRGHGDSDRSPEGHYLMGHFGADLRAVARQLDRPVAVGASLGGIAALVAEGESPDPMLRAVVLVDITPRVRPEGGRAGRRFHEGPCRDRLRLAGGSRRRGRRLPAEAQAPARPHRPAEEPARRRGRPLVLALGPGVHHRRPRAAGGPGPPSGSKPARACWPGGASPTLLVRGGSSDLVTETEARAFLDLAPHARFVDVSGAGHMVAGDRNDAFNTCHHPLPARFARLNLLRPAGRG